MGDNPSQVAIMGDIPSQARRTIVDGNNLTKTKLAYSWQHGNPNLTVYTVTDAVYFRHFQNDPVLINNSFCGRNSHKTKANKLQDFVLNLMTGSSIEHG